MHHASCNRNDNRNQERNLTSMKDIILPQNIANHINSTKKPNLTKRLHCQRTPQKQKKLIGQTRYPPAGGTATSIAEPLLARVAQHDDRWVMHAAILARMRRQVLLEESLVIVLLVLERQLIRRWLGHSVGRWLERYLSSFRGTININTLHYTLTYILYLCDKYDGFTSHSIVECMRWKTVDGGNEKMKQNKQVYIYLALTRRFNHLGCLALRGQREVIDKVELRILSSASKEITGSVIVSVQKRQSLR